MKVSREKLVEILKIVGTAIVSILVVLGIVGCAGMTFRSEGSYVFEKVAKNDK